MPSTSEWEALQTALGGTENPTEFIEALKLPAAGYLMQNYGFDWNSEGGYLPGVYGRYRSSTPYYNSSTAAENLQFSEYYIDPSGSEGRSYGLPVRCFQNGSSATGIRITYHPNGGAFS